MLWERAPDQRLRPSAEDCLLRGSAMAHDLRDTAAQSTRADASLFAQPDDLPEPDLTENRRIVLERRYLRREGGKVIESPRGGFSRVALAVGRGAGWCA